CNRAAQSVVNGHGSVHRTGGGMPVFHDRMAKFVAHFFDVAGFLGIKSYVAAERSVGVVSLDQVIDGVIGVFGFSTVAVFGRGGLSSRVISCIGMPILGINGLSNSPTRVIFIS